MINAAVVGLGWWGKTLVESGEHSDAIRFVAGATRTVSPEIEAFAKEKQLRLAPSYEALLVDPGIDAVVLATPHSMHAGQVIAAAAAGKHVFCEKPFTLSKRDAEAAVAAVQKAGVTLGLGYNRRFHPEMTKLRQRIRSGELGTILHVALQAVDDAKTLLTPFLPRSSQAVHEMLGGTGAWSGMPRIETVDEDGAPSYPVITGSYDESFRWASRPVAAGTPLSVPAPLFAKLDQSVVDEEIARLAGDE